MTRFFSSWFILQDLCMGLMARHNKGSVWLLHKLFTLSPTLHGHTCYLAALTFKHVLSLIPHFEMLFLSNSTFSLHFRTLLSLTDHTTRKTFPPLQTACSPFSRHVAGVKRISKKDEKTGQLVWLHKFPLFNRYGVFIYNQFETLR